MSQEEPIELSVYYKEEKKIIIINKHERVKRFKEKVIKEFEIPENTEIRLIDLCKKQHILQDEFEICKSQDILVEINCKPDIYEFYVDNDIVIENPFLPKEEIFPKIINMKIEVNELLAKVQLVLTSKTQKQYYLILNEYAEAFSLYPPCSIDKLGKNVIRIIFDSYVPSKFSLLNSENENFENVYVSYSQDFSQSQRIKTDSIIGNKVIYIRFENNIQQSNFLVQNTQKEDLAIILYNNRNTFQNDILEFFDKWNFKHDQNILFKLPFERIKNIECSTRLLPFELISIEDVHKPHLIYLRSIYLIIYNWINNNYKISNNEIISSFLYPNVIIDKFKKEVIENSYDFLNKTVNYTPLLTINREEGNRVRNGSFINKNRSIISQFTKYYIHNKDKFRNKSKPFNITYIGEKGIDSCSGLMHEFFSEFVKDINSENVGLFIQTPNAKNDKAKYPNCVIPFPSHNLHNISDLYITVGAFIGIIIRTEFKQPDISFPSLFWKYLCEGNISYEDIYEIDNDYYIYVHGLTEAFNSEMSNSNFEELANSNDFFGSQSITKKMDGTERITRANYEKIINEYHKLRISEISSQLEMIRTGFWENLGFEKPKYTTPELLSFLVCGENIITFQYLESHIIFKKAKDISEYLFNNQKNMFLECLKCFSNEERKKFIKFSTGLMSIPSNTKLVILILYTKKGQKWPIAHTCFNKLEIGCFSTHEKMLYALKYVINESLTFENS